jgi:hypothetical protein
VDDRCFFHEDGTLVREDEIDLYMYRMKEALGDLKLFWIELEVELVRMESLRMSSTAVLIHIFITGQSGCGMPGVEIQLSHVVTAVWMDQAQPFLGLFRIRVYL